MVEGWKRKTKKSKNERKSEREITREELLCGWERGSDKDFERVGPLSTKYDIRRISPR